MNETNPLEKLLRCWTPRRPSAKLKARLFAGAQPGPNPGRELPWQPSWRWFAPIAGVSLLTLVTLNDHSLNSAYLTRSQSNSVLASVALSNQTVASYVTSPDAFDRNPLPSATFESTTASRTASSIGSFLLVKTNSLMR